MYYTYVLKSLKDGNLYIGQTSDIEKRLTEHNSGLCKSTKSRIPFKLIHQEEFKTRSEAMKREKELKTGRGRESIRKMLV
jgi:putative endonuclease